MGVSTIGHRCLELTIVASLCAVALHRAIRWAQVALGVALAAALVAVAALGRALIQLDFGLTYVADFARRDSDSLYDGHSAIGSASAATTTQWSARLSCGLCWWTSSSGPPAR